MIFVQKNMLPDDMTVLLTISLQISDKKEKESYY